MQRSRCVDDFPAIRARMEELQREREQAARKNAAGQDHGAAGSPDRRDGTSRRPISIEEQRRVFSKAAREPHRFRACDLIG